MKKTDLGWYIESPSILSGVGQTHCFHIACHSYIDFLHNIKQTSSSSSPPPPPSSSPPPPSSPSSPPPSPMGASLAATAKFCFSLSLHLVLLAPVNSCELHNYHLVLSFLFMYSSSGLSTDVFFLIKRI